MYIAIRCLKIFIVFGFRFLRFTVLIGWQILTQKSLTLRQNLVQELPSICEILGGAFPKFGQILATRADLLPADICEALGRLQDRVQPIKSSVVERILLQSGSHQIIQDIDLVPIASATIAQVHRGIRRDNGQVVALKIRRPHVQKILQSDCQIIQFFGKFIAKIPVMQGIPVRDALQEVGTILNSQTDFDQEAKNLQHLHRLFANCSDVVIPLVHEDLCKTEILVMEFLPGLQKLNDPALPEPVAKKVLTIGVQALYRMIFQEGFIHCDMHPGNILVSSDSRLAILDAGFMTQLHDTTRSLFAKFFLAIALGDGQMAAHIVRETAQHLPAGLSIQEFDNEIVRLIQRVGGLQARDFQVAGFVGELFMIQNKYDMRGTNQFTLAILSLLVFEGVAKQRFPELDFQQAALPFVMDALVNK